VTLYSTTTTRFWFTHVANLHPNPISTCRPRREQRKKLVASGHFRANDVLKIVAFVEVVVVEKSLCAGFAKSRRDLRC
jgi:hypothetical protein